VETNWGLFAGGAQDKIKLRRVLADFLAALLWIGIIGNPRKIKTDEDAIQSARKTETTSVFAFSFLMRMCTPDILHNITEFAH